MHECEPGLDVARGPRGRPPPTAHSSCPPRSPATMRLQLGFLEGALLPPCKRSGLQAFPSNARVLRCAADSAAASVPAPTPRRARVPAHSRPRVSRPRSGAPNSVLLEYLSASCESGGAGEVSWAVRELATRYGRAGDAPVGQGDVGVLPFALWRSALYACLSRCRDLQAGMVVLHIGEPLVARATLRRDAYVPVVGALAYAHRWSALIDLYTRLWTEEGRVAAARPDERLVVYGTNLSVNAGRTSVATELVATAMRAGLNLSVFTYAVLLKGYGRARKQEAVTRTLATMREKGVEFDTVTFNSAVDAYIRCGNMTAARALVDDPAYANLRETRTFNILLKGLSRRGLVEKAYAVRDEMLAAGFIPNEVTQNTLIDACVRGGDFSAALRLARDILPGPGSVVGARPDQRNQLTIALSQILAGMADSGKLDDATRLLDEMSSRGAPPNHITYSALITACLRQGDFARAKLLFQTQEERTGVPPTLEIYNAMIAGLCKAGSEFHVDAAVRLLCGMREASYATESNTDTPLPPGRRVVKHSKSRRVTPSDATYNSVIDGLVSFSRVHDAEDVLEWMREDGVTPSVITYTTLIKGWSVERDLAEARRVFRTMTKDGVVPDAPAYNALIHACVRANNVAAAENVLELMESGTVDLDIVPGVYSYTPLIALHTRHGDLDAVWSMYQRGRRHGMAVNIFVVTRVINAILTLGSSTARHGRRVERRAIADMSVSILEDAWTHLHGEKFALRQWRRSLLALFQSDPDLASEVASAGGGGALKSASEVIFERHGWNDISSGWRPF